MPNENNVKIEQWPFLNEGIKKALPNQKSVAGSPKFA